MTDVDVRDVDVAFRAAADAITDMDDPLGRLNRPLDLLDMALTHRMKDPEADAMLWAIHQAQACAYELRRQWEVAWTGTMALRKAPQYRSLEERDPERFERLKAAMEPVKAILDEDKAAVAEEGQADG